ncbi:MAG: glycosyltransferase family 4 protein [SAR202 cluster bacterium]|nr:glycosyltransferase family 4 protein [SAR202 cluster bacterium]
MNILVIHEVDWLKKITYEIHHLSELFSLEGHKVYAVDIPDPGNFSLDKITRANIDNYNRVYEKSSVKILRTPIIPIKGLNRLSAYFTSYKFIKKILIDYKIDIAFVYSIVNNIKGTIRACNELNIPIIHRTFDVVHEIIVEKYMSNFVRKMEKESYPKLDLVIANTPFMKTWAEEMGAKNVIVIPQGVDTNIMKNLPKDKELQKKYNINDNDKVVMYLGSILSHSGLDVIFNDMEKILKEIPEFRLLVVGDGPDLERLKQQSKQLGIYEKIIFTGFVPYKEVPRFCSLADLCINPFRMDGKYAFNDKLTPVKFFDFLSCGKPVLATPLQGTLYDFPKESNTIIYESLDLFTGKMIELLKNDSLDEVGQRGREFVGKNFTWDSVTRRMLSEFDNMIK